MLKVDDLKEKFWQIFGRDEELQVFFAPGRVNIIGEHIDYNGGLVFPCAIHLGTYLVLRKRDDNKVFAYSANFPQKGIIEEDLSNLQYNPSRGWFNYVTGIFYTLQEKGYPLRHGFDLYFYGDLPNGAGLSSSASIELVTAYALNKIYSLGIDKVELAKLCQESENRYNGVNCGIMDQFSVGMGKKDHGILLNCNTLDYEYIPFELKDQSLVIINSNVQRSLADSKYNERRRSCEKALKILQRHLEISHLCEVTPREWEDLQRLIDDEETKKRANHAIMENQRVKDAVEALKKEDLKKLGNLLYKSHYSLQKDYEVSVEQLDLLVELAKDYPGVWGARLTGAGFGGCTINIVDDQRVEGFIQFIAENYHKKTGLKPSSYITKIYEGVKELEK
ncbi:galactokinase [Anaerobranca gottschalkii]|uniref:Galactokinase n=1 Tax=Anaerobranca gottschalkii DSM 13577 TaxID=1120990 RepID=A0A1H9ZLC6_9FIRM|nr:galactokinase [Anaerobranca gottschalkii]SES82414.1 galactokinase [Anaerobranca gottschalkii DSM 13577]